MEPSEPRTSLAVWEDQYGNLLWKESEMRKEWQKVWEREGEKLWSDWKNEKKRYGFEVWCKIYYLNSQNYQFDTSTLQNSLWFNCLSDLYRIKTHNTKYTPETIKSKHVIKSAEVSSSCVHIDQVAGRVVFLFETCKQYAYTVSI